jgi:type VI secretion system protein ImpA
MDSSKLSSPLAGAGPSGPNLEYDADFLALERAQQGRPEQVIGDAVNAAEEPNWPDVRERAEALLNRSRDLRVAMSLTRALLQTEGFGGLATGLRIIRGLLECQWDTVHPQLDADEGNDPTSRINSLLGLAAPDGLLKTLRESPMVASPTLGRYSLRDIRMACGKQPVPVGVAAPPQTLQINAAFRDTALPSLESTATAVSDARTEVMAINTLLIDKVGAQSPELKPLLDDLNDIAGSLAEHLHKRGVGPPPSKDSAEAPLSGSALASNGHVSSRAEVVQQIERICEYYERHEPSSPIPLLLQRAKRLVSKDFMTIIRDLAPAGLAEAESIGGIDTSRD